MVALTDKQISVTCFSEVDCHGFWFLRTVERPPANTARLT